MMHAQKSPMKPKLVLGLLLLSVGFVLLGQSFRSVAIVGDNSENYAGFISIQSPTLRGYGFFATESASVDYLTAYMKFTVNGSPVNYRFAIYSKNLLLGVTEAGTASASENSPSWHKLNFSEPVSIVSGNFYVIVPWANNTLGSQANLYYKLEGVIGVVSQSYRYDNFPSYLS
jgi:hypothetical protein